MPRIGKKSQVTVHGSPQFATLEEKLLLFYYFTLNAFVIISIYFENSDEFFLLSQEDATMLLVTAAQMQELDKKAMEEFGILGLILLENAGRWIFEHFAARLHQGVTILVGPGLCLMGYPISPPVKLQNFFFKNSQKQLLLNT
jgi:hypothetical protein